MYPHDIAIDLEPRRRPDHVESGVAETDVTLTPLARSNVIAIVPPSWSTEYSRSPSTPTASPLVAPLTATKSCRHASDVGGSIHRLRTSKRFDRSSRAKAAPL